MEVSSTSQINVSANGRRQSHVYSVAPTTPAEISSVQSLYKFICAGPLLDKLGLTAEEVANSIDRWLTSGSQLCRLFQLNELFLNEAQKVRIYHYYIPVFLWCEDQISRHASMFKDGEDVPPLVVQITMLPWLCVRACVTQREGGEGERERERERDVFCVCCVLFFWCLYEVWRLLSTLFVAYLAE